MIHSLKTDAYVWDLVKNGLKAWEIRYNDRDFQIGDKLQLCKTKYTAKEMQLGAPLKYEHESVIAATVTHVFRGPAYGLKKGWVILSIRVEKFEK